MDKAQAMHQIYHVLHCWVILYTSSRMFSLLPQRGRYHSTMACTHTIM